MNKRVIRAAVIIFCMLIAARLAWIQVFPSSEPHALAALFK